MLCLRGALLCALAFVTLPVVARAEDQTAYQIVLKGKAFAPEHLKVPAGKTFFIKVRNDNDAPAEFESKDFKVEKIVAGHSEILARVKALKPGTYTFFDDYHEDETRGIITAE
ncbi:cupredoxin domain-containing protein [Taklimakanibacter albus]|uniref:Cupredoxin domain-containing protein n=1 Tax=Taklimakanibacter albus TaxID=2800327 RepID=A0ACC5RAV7_9HYPH|nr:cupredoxin domain-containing protein [Aestuariivirga sp. YIM B02566]MBK1869816.1 cupredoxin domain-containing protein [Aestuariivirga sp. YIM B02566]